MDNNPVDRDQASDPQHLVEQIQGASLDVKKNVFEEALKTAYDSDPSNAADLVRHAIGVIPSNDVEVRTAVVGKAVESAGTVDKQVKVLNKGIREAHQEAVESVVQDHGPSPQTFDKVWKGVVFTFAVVLGIATVGLFVIIGWDAASKSTSVEAAHLQIMLTVFTTTAGTLAGFITGHAVGKADEK